MIEDSVLKDMERGERAAAAAQYAFEAVCVAWRVEARAGCGEVDCGHGNRVL